eukprot:jgi/Chlat1/5329/Chrsp35S05204
MLKAKLVDSSSANNANNSKREDDNHHINTHIINDTDSHTIAKSSFSWGDVVSLGKELNSTTATPNDTNTTTTNATTTPTAPTVDTRGKLPQPSPSETSVSSSTSSRRLTSHNYHNNSTTLGVIGRNPEIEELEKVLQEEKSSHDNTRRELALLRKGMQTLQQQQMQMQKSGSNGSLSNQNSPRKSKKESKHTVAASAAIDMFEIEEFENSPHKKMHRFNPFKRSKSGRSKSGKSGLSVVDTPLSLDESWEAARNEELSQSTTEYRHIINVLSRESEGLRAQLAMTARLFEHADQTQPCMLLVPIQLTLPPPLPPVPTKTLLDLLLVDELDVRHVAAKAIANLAAQGESRQAEIIAQGGLRTLIDAIETSTDETTLRLAVGAVANLAMDSKDKKELGDVCGVDMMQVSKVATDPQTQRMVAGAIANLCGNNSLKGEIASSGALAALVEMAKSGHPDVQAQVARALANYVVRYEANASFVDMPGGLQCLVTLACSHHIAVRKHAGLALYQLAQTESTIAPIMAAGAVKALLEMRRCEREDVQRLAIKTIAVLAKNEDARSMIEQELNGAATDGRRAQDLLVAA